MIRLTEAKEIEPYLTDASRFRGEAEGVALPESEKEVSEFLREANAKKIPVTVSGAKTGLAGGAVPLGGWVLSTEKLSRILEIRKGREAAGSFLRVEPGIPLRVFEETLERELLFYPPDPTGKRAFIGGTVATNASGPNSFKYGATRPHVRRLRVVLADGEAVEIRRGRWRSNLFGVLEIPTRTKKLRIPVPDYRWPRTKHAGGYFTGPRLDAIDLFIGSEGTLGVVTEIELGLLSERPEAVAFIVFFKSEEDSWRFARLVRARSLRNRKKGVRGNLEARALEYFDSGSLDFLRPAFPSVPNEARAALLIEQETTPRTGKPLLEEWDKFFEKEGTLTPPWIGETPEKQKEFRRFRSELPLAVNDCLARYGQGKFSTDTAVPDEKFEELMQFHRRETEASGLRGATFGHIGESHVHLNLLPRNEAERARARSLYQKLVRKAMALGGTFSGEHGVGKLKRIYLAELYGRKGIEAMSRLKRVFDPNGILGRGNLFEIE